MRLPDPRPGPPRGVAHRLQHEQAPQRARLAHPGRVRRGLAPPTTAHPRIAGGSTIGIPSLSEIKGSEYLRDVVIERSQVIPLAEGVFAGLNIRVEDDREADVGSVDSEESSKPRKRPN